MRNPANCKHAKNLCQERGGGGWGGGFKTEGNNLSLFLRIVGSKHTLIIVILFH